MIARRSAMLRLRPRALRITTWNGQRVFWSGTLIHIFSISKKDLGGAQTWRNAEKFANDTKIYEYIFFGIIVPRWATSDNKEVEIVGNYDASIYLYQANKLSSPRRSTGNVLA